MDRIVLAIGLVFASAAATVASEEDAASRLQRFFPPEASLCATPPSHGPTLGSPSETTEPPESQTPVRVETHWDDARDVYVMQWMGVDARPLSEEVTFEVREGTVGILLRAETAASGWNVAVELLKDGKVLVCEECPDAPAVGEMREGRGSAHMPSTDRPGYELAPGEYSFRVRATPRQMPVVEDGVTVDVLATFRSDAAVLVEHRLDLNLVYLPGCTLTKAVADTSELFAALLTQIDASLAPAGIRLGRVTQVDLDRPGFSVIADWEEAGRMFRTSRQVGQPRALNVYCLQSFEPPLNPVVGLAGGIPGPLQNGTRDSGVAVRMSPLFTCGEDCLPAFGGLFAHEIGHYLGFYHTTEGPLGHFDPPDHWDPIADTPQCEGDFPYACPDYGYVMFPLIHAANVTWSSSQARIAQTHPLVRTVPIVVARESSVERSARTALAVASPNPFQDTVRFQLPAPHSGTLSLFDVGGRSIRRLAVQDGSVTWDGRDPTGHHVPAGIYFARWSDGAGSSHTIRVVRVE